MPPSAIGPRRWRTQAAHGEYSAPLTTAWMREVEPRRERRPRATQGDAMDGGGRATPGAVAEALTKKSSRLWRRSFNSHQGGWSKAKPCARTI